MSSNLPALSLGVCRAASRKAPLCLRARLWEHGVCRDGSRTTKRSCFVLGYCRGRQRLRGCAEKRKGGALDVSCNPFLLSNLEYKAQVCWCLKRPTHLFQAHTLLEALITN